jgi:hypothetical protein
MTYCSQCATERIIIEGAYFRGRFQGFCNICLTTLVRSATLDSCPPGTQIGFAERRGHGFKLIKA